MHITGGSEFNSHSSGEKIKIIRRVGRAPRGAADPRRDAPAILPSRAPSLRQIRLVSRLSETGRLIDLSRISILPIPRILPFSPKRPKPPPRFEGRARLALIEISVEFYDPAAAPGITRPGLRAHLLPDTRPGRARPALCRLQRRS